MAEIPPSHDDASCNPRDQVHWIGANRAAIEQAKGILMFVYAIDAHRAFRVMRSRARTSRVSLRLLSEQFVNDVSALTQDERRDIRSACTRLLHTAHQRVVRVPESD